MVDIRQSSDTSKRVQHELLNTSVLTGHLALLESRLLERLGMRTDLQIESGQTALQLHNPALQSLPSGLESFQAALASPFPEDIRRAALLKGASVFENPFHILEACPDGNKWGVVMGGHVEGFSGWGSTLPDALRALADDLEKPFKMNAMTVTDHLAFIQTKENNR